MEYEMKRYIKPQVNIHHLDITHPLLAGSGGAKTGDTVNNEYLDTDVTYSRSTSSAWDEEE